MSVSQSCWGKNTYGQFTVKSDYGQDFQKPFYFTLYFQNVCQINVCHQKSFYLMKYSESYDQLRVKNDTG